MRKCTVHMCTRFSHKCRMTTKCITETKTSSVHAPFLSEYPINTKSDHLHSSTDMCFIVQWLYLVSYVVLFLSYVPYKNLPTRGFLDGHTTLFTSTVTSTYIRLIKLKIYFIFPSCTWYIICICTFSTAFYSGTITANYVSRTL